MNQLEKVMEVTGMPTSEAVANMRSPFAKTMLESVSSSQMRRVDLRSLIPGVSPEAYKLLEACLNFDPALRCSAEQALAHPYVAEFHNPDEEPVFPYGPIFINLDDNVKLSAADYRDKLYREISKRKKEMRRKSERGGDE